jgi:pimeloyl-ACP methyl ester carboxylesterase
MVGQSFGAYIAAAYAAMYPEHVKGLLLVAAPASRSAAEHKSAADLVARFRAEGLMTVMEGLVSAWCSDEFRENNPDSIKQRLIQIRTIDPKISIATYEFYNNFDLAGVSSQIRCPTIVMTGEFARGCNADSARSLAQKIERSVSMVLPGLKNGLPTEAPNAIVASIQQLADPSLAEMTSRAEAAPYLSHTLSRRTDVGTRRHAAPSHLRLPSAPEFPDRRHCGSVLFVQ